MFSFVEFRSLSVKAVIFAALASGTLAGCVADDFDSRSAALTTQSTATRYPTVQNCGNWKRDMTDTSANEHYPNYGCAVKANIAAMVADPSDLYRPKRLAPARASVAVKAQQTLSGDAGDTSSGSGSSGSSSDSSSSASSSASP